MKMENMDYVNIPIEMYETAYNIYINLYKIRAVGKDAVQYQELIHSHGILSLVASKVVSNTHNETGHLSFDNFKQQFNLFLPSVLSDFTLQYRLLRLRLSDYNKALSLCTSNNKLLETTILKQMTESIQAILNTSAETKDIVDKEFRALTYHRVIKIQKVLKDIWETSNNMIKAAFIFHNSLSGKNVIENHVINLYKQLIHASGSTIENVFLYSKFEDDINHVSVVFPLKTVDRLTISSAIHNLIGSVDIPTQLVDEYKTFKIKIDNYE